MDTNAIRVVESQEIIFKEGDQGNLMYVLLEGAVELKKKVEGGEAVLKIIDQQNDFFGEMALIDGRPRSAAAVAAKKSKLLPVDGPTFESMILSNGKFALKIIKVLSDRLRHSNEQVEELIETSPKERILFGMADFARKINEQIHDGCYKVDVEEMKAWINGRLGFTFDEIDAYIFRLLKDQTLIYAATSAKTKQHLLLSAKFVREHDRRR